MNFYNFGFFLDIQHVNPYRRACRMLTSCIIVLIMLLASLSVIATIYVVRRALYEDIGNYAQAVASLMNALQIALFNVLYGLVATSLNDWENHRTGQQPEPDTT